MSSKEKKGSVMSKKEDIQNEIKKTLDCFDRTEPIKTDPYFYTRLKARLEDTESTEIKLGWGIWNVLKPALLMSIIALNIYTGLMFFKSQKVDEPNRQELINSFAQELTLDSNQYSPNPFLNE
jgi:hypothetical protein